MKLFSRRAKPASQRVVAPVLDNQATFEYWRDRCWKAEDDVRVITARLTIVRQQTASAEQRVMEMVAESRRLGGLVSQLQQQIAELRTGDLSAKTLKFDRSCRVCLELMPWGTQHVCRGMAATARGAQS